MPQVTSVEDQTQVWTVKRSYLILGTLILLFINFITPVFYLTWAIIYQTNIKDRYTLKPDLIILGFAPFALFMWVLGIFAYVSIAGSILAIGPGGLTYASAGYIIRARWSKLLGYGKVSSNNATVEGYLVNDDAREVTGWLSTLTGLMPIISILTIFSGRYVAAGNLNYTRVIPLKSFDSHSQRGPMAELVRRYAPFLIDSDGNPRSGNFAAAPLELVKNEPEPPSREVITNRKDKLFLWLNYGSLAAIILMLVVGFLIAIF